MLFRSERYAFADGDNQRGKNQMAVIQAIISKASSPAVLKNYQTLLSSLSDAFITSLSYDDIASLVQMQLQDMSGWHVTSYAVSGSGDTSYCYALGDAAWVMRPNMDTVNTAKELIRQVIGVPTVVDAATIVHDSMAHLLEALEEAEQKEFLEEMISPHLHTMFVTPKDVDETVKYLSFTISEGLNMAFEEIGG